MRTNRGRCGAAMTIGFSMTAWIFFLAAISSLRWGYLWGSASGLPSSTSGLNAYVGLITMGVYTWEGNIFSLWYSYGFNWNGCTSGPQPAPTNCSSIYTASSVCFAFLFLAMLSSMLMGFLACSPSPKAAMCNVLNAWFSFAFSLTGVLVWRYGGGWNNLLNTRQLASANPGSTTIMRIYAWGEGWAYDLAVVGVSILGLCLITTMMAVAESKRAHYDDSVHVAQPMQAYPMVTPIVTATPVYAVPVQQVGGVPYVVQPAAGIQPQGYPPQQYVPQQQMYDPQAAQANQYYKPANVI